MPLAVHGCITRMQWNTGTKKKKSINDRAGARRVFPVPHSWVSLPWHYLRCSCHTHGLTQMAFIYFSFYISHEMRHPFSLLILKSEVLACFRPHSTCLPHCILPLIYLNAPHFNSIHLLHGALISTWLAVSFCNYQKPLLVSSSSSSTTFFKLQTDDKDCISDIWSLINQTQTTTSMSD